METNSFEKKLEFSVHLDSNIVVKRVFTIDKYVKESLHTMSFHDNIHMVEEVKSFNEVMDMCVEAIKNDLSYKSVCWLFPPKVGMNGYVTDEDLLVDESTLPKREAWSSVIEVRLKEVNSGKLIYSRIFDASQYHPAVLNRIDLTNKMVRLIDREGNMSYKDREEVFGNPNTYLTPDLYMQKICIWKRPDIVSMCINKIVRECSYRPSKKQVDTIVTVGDKTYQTSLLRAERKLESDYIKSRQTSSN